MAQLVHSQAQLIKLELATGRLTDTGKVIAEAPVLLDQQDKAPDKLQAKVQEGSDDLAINWYISNKS